MSNHISRTIYTPTHSCGASNLNIDYCAKLIDTALAYQFLTFYLHQYVGLLIAIARERSEAFYLGYVFRTYGTEVLTYSIGIWREAPDCIRATCFLERRESG